MEPTYLEIVLELLITKMDETTIFLHFEEFMLVIFCTFEGSKK